MYEYVRAVDAEVMILRAMEPSDQTGAGAFKTSPTWPGLVNEFARAREIYYPECSHFIPMQQPDKVIDVPRAEVAAWRRVR